MNSYPVAGLNVGTLHFVLAPRFLDGLSEQQQRAPNLPAFTKILQALQQSGQAGGVAAIVMDNEENKRRLWVFIDTYYLEFYELDKKRDGYRLARIHAIDLYANNQLARGYILLRASWRAYTSLGGPSGIPQGSNSYWNDISRQWDYVVQSRENQASQAATRQVEALSQRQKEFLTTIDNLIKSTRNIEQEKNKNPTIIPYSSFESTAEEQYELRSIYVFHLTHPMQINLRDMLRLTCNGESGRIFTLEDERMTVKFEKAIDENSIDPRGTFEIVANEVSFRAQQNAVEVLQKREGSNQHLLDVLVDQKYRPYQPAHEAPAITLNPAQEQAFQRAISVPDLLLVLGPPGTGKTQTIQEIVKAYERRKQRILVTSKANRAVDNALERLISDDMLVVRFGHEDSVSETMRSQLIDMQAEKLQKEILSKTNDRAAQLSGLMTNGPYITKWIEQAQKHVKELGQLESDQQAAQLHINARRDLYRHQYGTRFEQWNAQRKTLEIKLGKRQRWLAIEDVWKRRLEGWRQSPVLGFIWIPLLAIVVERWQTYKKQIQVYEQKIAEVQNSYAAEQQRMEQEIQHDPAYREYCAQLEQYAKHYTQVQTETQRAVKVLHGYIEQLTPNKEPQLMNAREIAAYLAWYNHYRQLSGRRYKLLNTWRGVLEKRVKALYSELLLYADVVGATCVGVATVQALAEASFDAVIVDEAAQINLLDLLIPLVKAKRAILVGDHQQLPPFVDSEVQDWLKSLKENEESTDSESEESTERVENTLLEKSMFELLYTAQANAQTDAQADAQANTENIVRLNIQYRMPKVVADYAARHFYESNLETAERKLREVIFNDQLFQKSLVFIDTAQLPRKIRYDSAVGWVNEKPRAIKGERIFNIREAELIAELACMYQNEHTRWIVIVPYSAQAQRIRALLADMPQMAGIDTEYRVATVDSFQGGESPVVIYGFTRSNPWRTIGFLSEVRRLNVALTRAQQRLILVGDSQTVTSNGQQRNRPQKIARKNVRFFALMDDLYNHTRQNGQLLSYEECMRKIKKIQQ